MKLFSEMLMRTSITDDYVEKEKSTVQLERGKPSPIEEFFGFSPLRSLTPKYLNRDNYMKTEFGVEHIEYPDVVVEQLSTRKLTKEQVQAFYDKHYTTNNLRIFVAGRFDKA